MRQASISSYDRFAPPPYLRNLRQLTIHDEEYTRVAYELRASLRSLTVKILSVHAINSPQQDATFEGNHLGVTVLDSWVNGRDLPEQNSVHNLIAHGGRFRITDTDKGAIFSTGAITLDDVPAGPTQYEFVHCRVAVGRSFVVDPQQVGQHGIPAGYDSIKIHKEADEDPNKYLHEYIINDESRVYPDFVVNFVFDAASDQMKVVPNCDACDVRAAVVYCMQDDAKLCDNCDREMHSKSRIYERHQRVLLNEMQTTVGMTMCKEHTHMAVQFFDPIAHVPVCIHCKMSGSHSTGENATHPLVNITEAFDASMDDLERERLIIEERRKTIAAQSASINVRMQQVQENHNRCHEQIYEIVQRAVQILHEETESKMSALLSDQMELERQREFYNWMESFLKYQKSCVNPVEFLQLFKAHSSVLAQAPSEIVDGGACVRPDIRVLGRLDVVVDDTNAALPPSVQRSGVEQPSRQQQGNPNRTPPQSQYPVARPNSGGMGSQPRRGPPPQAFTHGGVGPQQQQPQQRFRGGPPQSYY